MAYKFQLGPAVLSGSTKFEDQLEIAGGLAFSGSHAGAVAVADDHFMFFDGGADGVSKVESIADLMTAVAGDGLGAASGVLKVDVSDFAGTGLEDDGSENLRISTAAAGDGLGGGGAAALSVNVDDSSIEINGDALRIKASGVDAAKLNTDVISAQVELAHADIADADELMISDGGVLKKTGVDSLRDHFFGVVSGDAAIADGGALTIADLAVETGMLANDAVTAAKLADDAVVNDSVVDGALKADKLDIDGSTDIGADLVDADLFLVDDGAGGTNRKSTLTRVKKYIYSAMSGDATASDAGALTIAAGAVEGSMLNSNVPGLGLHLSGSKVHLSASVAGSGLSFSSGVLAFDMDEFAALGGTGVAQGDHFIFSDDGTEKRITFSNLEDAIFGNVSGDATIAAGGALTIAAGAVEHGMLAEDIISGQAELAHADINDDDEMMIDDAGVVKKVGVDSLRDHFFGVVSGDATIADGGALTIANDAVENAMMADDSVGAAAMADDAVGTSVIVDNAVTLAKLAGITRGSIILGDASGDPSLLAKGSSAQFLQSDGADPSYVTISGDATVAAGGALTVALPVTTHGDNTNALQFGINVQTADFTAARTKALPTPVAGRTVVVKGKNNNAFPMTIEVANTGTQRIDGSNTSVVLESEGGAVTLMCINSTKWIIV